VTRQAATDGNKRLYLLSFDADSCTKPMQQLPRENETQHQLYPSCDHELTAADINIGQGVALCPSCGTLSQLSEVNFSSVRLNDVEHEHRTDIKLRENHRPIIATVSLRSFMQFLGAAAFAAFWNSIVAIFLSFAVAAIYYRTFGPIPEWFPTPGIEDGVPIMNDEPMGIGSTVFLCLFLTPFVMVGTGMSSYALLRLFGTTTIIIGRDTSSVSTGIGPLRWKRKFQRENVEGIRKVRGKLKNDDETTYLIQVDEKNRNLKFGRLLETEQMDWTIALLKLLLLQRKTPKNIRQPDWLR
jgi:hypothetical protein